MNCSHAEGSSTTASGNYSHAEGHATIASQDSAHAEGYGSKASGTFSHAENNHTTASGNASHAEGYYTTASGSFSHAEGYYTTASGDYQHAQGKYNIVDSTDKYIHVVGNGTSSTKRSNAHTLDWDGNAWFQSNVYIGGAGQDDETAKVLATREYVDTKVPDNPGSYKQLVTDAGGNTKCYNCSVKNIVPVSLKVKYAPTT